jgi:hypothetical protein
VAYSWVTYTGDGNTTNFSITFTFISRTHVKVYLDSVESTDWSWVSDGVIAMDTAPAEGVVVRIQRETPKDSRLVTFQDAAIMTAEDQNDSADQNFMSMQEEYDNQSNYLQLGTDDKYNAQSKVIKAVADGVADNDAVNVSQMQPYQTAAEAAQTAAEAAQAAAETAQTAAELAETNAETAETNAETAETNAETAETNAAASAAAASTSETNAGTSETNALSHKNDAETAQTAAETAQTAAETAQTAAEAAQAAAETAQTNAETAETNAETAETNAETAETNAEAAEAKAEKWAEETEDVEVETGKYSAKHWAAKAEAHNPVNAIHDDVPGEISAISEKTTPVDADLVLIEDSEASDAKKSVKLQNLHLPDDYAANMQWGGTKRHLLVKWNANGDKQVDITANKLELRNDSGHKKLLTSVSVLNVDISVSGAGGLDTGSEAASTLYFIYVIAKPDDTVSACYSTSALSPTLPSGYTYYRRVGEIYNKSDSNFDRTIRMDDWVWLYNAEIIYTGHTLTTSYVSHDFGAAIKAVSPYIDHMLLVAGVTVGNFANLQVVSPWSSGVLGIEIQRYYNVAAARGHDALYQPEYFLYPSKKLDHVFARVNLGVNYANQALAVKAYHLPI